MNFPGLLVCDDVTPADWVRERLWPWDVPGNRVGMFVPDGYAGYGRVLHPVYEQFTGRKVRWSEIAGHRGRAVDATTRFNDLVGWQPSPEQPAPPAPWSEPNVGSLEADECTALAGVLAHFTSTPDQCWFCLWEGYGWAQLPQQFEGPPRVRLEHRDCLLFTGAVAHADAFRSPPWFQSPTLWWPDDRAWCVASELDVCSTYVAAGAECVAALVTDPRLEVVACAAEDRIDPSPWAASG